MFSARLVAPDIPQLIQVHISYLMPGEERRCEPHLQDRQGPQRAGLLPQAAWPGGVRGALREVPDADLRPMGPQSPLAVPCLISHLRPPPPNVGSQLGADSAVVMTTTDTNRSITHVQWPTYVYICQHMSLKRKRGISVIHLNLTCRIRGIITFGVAAGGICYLVSIYFRE